MAGRRAVRGGRRAVRGGRRAVRGSRRAVRGGRGGSKSKNISIGRWLDKLVAFRVSSASRIAPRTSGCSRRAYLHALGSGLCAWAYMGSRLGALPLAHPNSSSLTLTLTH